MRVRIAARSSSNPGLHQYSRGHWYKPSSSMHEKRLRSNQFNDFGRPYGEGWNTENGFSAYATYSHGVVEGVMTSQGEYRCRLVVDATGGAYWLARHLGIQLLRISKLLIAKYGWIDSDDDLLKNGRIAEFDLRWRRNFPRSPHWPRENLAADLAHSGSRHSEVFAA
jgi:hypothetical protein